MALRKYRSDPVVPEVTTAPVSVRFLGHIVEKKDDNRTVVAQIEVPGVQGMMRTEISLLNAKFARVRLSDVVAGSATISKFYSENVNGMVTSISPKNVVIRDAGGRQVV